MYSKEWRGLLVQVDGLPNRRNALWASAFGLILLLGGCQRPVIEKASADVSEFSKHSSPSVGLPLSQAPRLAAPTRMADFVEPKMAMRKIPPCDGREYRLRDLEVETLRVAYQDVEQLMQLLTTLGYETVRVPTKGVAPGLAQGGIAGQNPGQYSGQYSGQYPGQMPGQPQGQYQGQFQGQSTAQFSGTTPAMTGSMMGQLPGQISGAMSGQAAQQFAGQMPAQAGSPPMSQKYGCDRLPVIVMPPPINDQRLGFGAADFLGLGGGSSSSGGSGGSGGPGGFMGGGGGAVKVGGDISPALHSMSKPHSGEVDHLLVFYHPEQVDQLRELQSLVRKRLDVQARQVYIEGLVLEVSEDGLRDLGIRFDRINPESNQILGVGVLGASPVAAGGAEVLGFLRDSQLQTDPALINQSLLQIQALVSSGAAEVLSRPSVLTLSNRQATIQIIDIVQFPIQEATITGSGDIVQSAFTFEAVRPGITLNLRPRVSADLEFVSLEIDVTVEALVTANNGEVRNDQGQVIATKPGSSARRVQTFARIPDRTPIIIGGLISSDKEDISNRIPLLGDIPWLGSLFGATSKVFGKREVIIVLTPYVVGEDGVRADMSVPKDTSLFDIEDTTLFHDSYRVRSEDVYDLRFLLDSPEFGRRQRTSQQMRERHPQLTEREPFKQFLDGNIPGGEMFLNRMMFDLVGRREFGKDVAAEQLIVMGNTSSGTPEVALISELFAEAKAEENKALVMVFGDKPEPGVNQAAQIRIEERPADKSWDDLLWELSYGAADGIERTAIILRNEKDLESLVKSTVSTAVLTRNGGYDKLNIGRFSQGTMLSIPTFDADRYYLVDKKVARVFTDVRHYYRAAGVDLERSYQAFDKAITGGLPEQINNLSAESDRSPP